MGRNQSGLNLSNLQSGVEDIFSFAAGFIPGLGDNPFVQDLQRRQVGRQMTEELRTVEPDLSRISPTGAATSFRMQSSKTL